MNNTHLPTRLVWQTHNMTAARLDLACSPLPCVRAFPNTTNLFAIREYTFNNVTKAIAIACLAEPYVDGIKAAIQTLTGFCLIGSAKRDENRLISVVLGTNSDNCVSAKPGNC